MKFFRGRSQRVCRRTFGGGGRLLRSPHETAQAIGEKQETLPVALRCGGTTFSWCKKPSAKGFICGQSLQFQGRPSGRDSMCLPPDLLSGSVNI
ncbi:hypothetical protein [Kamptonema formosum]|uniref:hypothetical protein n=1 Tax=Kamptonema formosum TaxID=331992 RepID=UPI0003493F1F|nr:hypothetical protein [Oscillatoria sp. PCC 10802]